MYICKYTHAHMHTHTHTHTHSASIFIYIISGLFAYCLRIKKMEWFSLFCCVCLAANALTLYVCICVWLWVHWHCMCVCVSGCQCTGIVWCVCVCLWLSVHWHGVCVCLWLSMHSDRHCERQTHALNRLPSVLNSFRMTLLKIKSCSIHSRTLPTLCLVLNAPVKWLTPGLVNANETVTVESGEC